MLPSARTLDGYSEPCKRAESSRRKNAPRNVPIRSVHVVLPPENSPRSTISLFDGLTAWDYRCSLNVKGPRQNLATSRGFNLASEYEHAGPEDQPITTRVLHEYHPAPSKGPPADAP